MHINEHNKEIDTKNFEVQEQKDASKYIEPNDVVLEIGGRYGSVSTKIQENLGNKKAHVVVEPDTLVIPALQKNKEINNDEYSIFHGLISQKNVFLSYISDGYGTRYYDTMKKETSTPLPIDVLTYNEFCRLYPLDFNVLVVDCEGCFEQLLDEIGDHIRHYRLVLLELDWPDRTNYNRVHDILLQNGFRRIRSGTHSIYTNNTPLPYDKGISQTPPMFVATEPPLPVSGSNSLIIIAVLGLLILILVIASVIFIHDKK